MNDNQTTTPAPINTTGTTVQPPVGAVITPSPFAEAYAKFLSYVSGAGLDSQALMPDPKAIEVDLKNANEASILGVADKNQTPQTLARLNALNEEMRTLQPNAVRTFESMLAVKTGVENVQAEDARNTMLKALVGNTLNNINGQPVTVAEVKTLVTEANRVTTQAVSKPVEQPAPVNTETVAPVANQQPPTAPPATTQPTQAQETSVVQQVMAEVAAKRNEATEKRMKSTEARLIALEKNINAVFARMDTHVPGLRHRMVDYSTNPDTRISSDLITKQLLKEVMEQTRAYHMRVGMDPHAEEMKSMGETLEAIQSMSKEDIDYHLAANGIDSQKPNPIYMKDVVENLSGTYGKNAIAQIPFQRAAEPFLTDLRNMVESQAGRDALLMDQPKAQRMGQWLANALVHGVNEEPFYAGRIEESEMVQKKIDTVQQRHQYFKNLSMANKKLLLEHAGMGGMESAMTADKSENYFHSSPVAQLGETINQLMSGEMTLATLQQDERYAARFKVFEQQEQTYMRGNSAASSPEAALASNDNPQTVSLAEFQQQKGIPVGTTTPVMTTPPASAGEQPVVGQNTANIAEERAAPLPVAKNGMGMN